MGHGYLLWLTQLSLVEVLIDDNGLIVWFKIRMTS